MRKYIILYLTIGFTIWLVWDFGYACTDQAIFHVWPDLFSGGVVPVLTAAPHQLHSGETSWISRLFLSKQEVPYTKGLH